MLDTLRIKSHEMLDLDDLRLVRAIGTSRSLAAAARLLDLTPPAVTIRLQRMEARLNARLAVRQPKGIALTDEGQRLYQEAVGILERVEALPVSIAGDHGDVQGDMDTTKYDEAHQVMADLTKLGDDYDDVITTLER